MKESFQHNNAEFFMIMNKNYRKAFKPENFSSLSETAVSINIYHLTEVNKEIKKKLL
jgi:hypothetical protein